MHIVFKSQETGGGRATLCIDRESQHIEVTTNMPPEELEPWLAPLLKGLKLGLPVYIVIPTTQVNKWHHAGWEVVDASVMVKR